MDNVANEISYQMGFTTSKHPELQSKVNARIRKVTGDMNQQEEDAAVQDILEELLTQQPSGSSAPASGLRRSQTLNMPGGL